MKSLKDTSRVTNASTKIRLLVIGAFALVLSLVVYSSLSTTSAAVRPSPMQRASNDQASNEARRKLTVDYRDWLRYQIKQCNDQISAYQLGIRSTRVAYMIEVYQGMIAACRDLKAAYLQALAQVETALTNWETLSKKQIFPWERPQQSRPMLPPQSGYGADEPCRMCYTCRGTGSIGPFGNPYSGAGYRPAETCPNCHGSGQVCRRE